MQRSTLAKRAWFFLFLIIAAFYLYGLGHIPLMGPDEPRYAEVAREMLERHDLITPTLGNLPWFEKPPLLYWLMMASFRVFGVSEYAARLGPALCALATAIFVYWVGATANSSATVSEESLIETDDLPRWGTLAFLSSAGAMAFSRAASFDIVITMTLTGALAFFFVWEIKFRAGSERTADRLSDRRGLGLLVGFYGFIGLSLLAKGLIGILLPFGVLGFYFSVRREWPRSLLSSLVWGLPIAGAIAAVWYGPMIARHGWTFIDQFIVQHHFARFFTNKYHHRQPFYFYVVTIVWLVFPWTIFLAAAFVSSRRWTWRGGSATDRLRVFSMAWIIVPFVFFSLSESKLAAYILPVVPAAALLVGERIQCALRAGRGEKLIRFTGALLLIVVAAGTWVGITKMRVPSWCVFGIGFVPAVAALFALVLPRVRPAALTGIAASILIAAAVTLQCLAPVIAQRESVRDLLDVAAQRGYGSTPVVQLFTAHRTAEFYSAGRLEYRPDGEPKMFESVAQVADAANRNGGIVLCIVPREYESILIRFDKLTSEELAVNDEVALLVVRPR